MTHRECFYETVTHGHPDRAVFDLCGSPHTVVDYDVTKKELAALLGITGEKQGSYDLDERILEALDIDTQRVGFMPAPASVHNRFFQGITYDNWGIGYREVNGHMESCYNPLKDATIDEMMAYPFPDPEQVDRKQLAYWTELAKHLKEETDYAVVAEHPVLGVMGDRGGYILSPAHTIQYDVPASNVIAIYQGAKEFYKKV